MYDNLIWDLANANAVDLVVFVPLVLILDYVRTILFKD